MAVGDPICGRRYVVADRQPEARARRFWSRILLGVVVGSLIVAACLLFLRDDGRSEEAKSDAALAPQTPGRGASFSPDRTPGAGPPSAPRGGSNPRTIRVRGQVRTDDNVVPHAYVEAIVDHRRTGTLTDGDGRFDVVIDASTRELTFAVAGFEVVARPRVVANQDRDDLMVEVRGGAAVQGRVLVRETPISGASVSILPGWVVKTDDAGRFRFDPVAAGSYTVRAEHEGREANAAMSVAVAAGETRTIDLELDHGGVIAGTVVDARGVPMAGVLVSWRCTDCVRRFANVLSGADGAYRVTHLGRGTYTPLLKLDGALLTATSPDGFPMIELRDAASHRDQVRLVVSAETADIIGRVIGVDGAPAGGIAVVVPPQPDPASPEGPRAALRRTTTRPDGTFMIRALPRGRYRVAVGEQGELGGANGVEAGGPEVVIRLVAMTTLRGKIEGFAAGSTKVGVVQGIDGRRELRPQPIAGSAFFIPDVAPGEAWIIATDGAGIAVESVQVGSAAELDVTLHPRPTANAAGTVHTSIEARGLVCFWLLNLPGIGRVGVGDSAQVTVAPDGRFAFAAPTGVPLTLSCSAALADGASARGTLEIAALGPAGASALRLDLAAP